MLFGQEYGFGFNLCGEDHTEEETRDIAEIEGRKTSIILANLRN
jgi:hypothetical protein